jgi:predicted ATP-binding protein involved in virulence
MKLEHLKLVNFRGFRSLEISFDPQFTVLLGDNMAGKTAVLDGIALALSQILGREHALRLEESEVRQVVAHSGGVPSLTKQFPVEVEVRAADTKFDNGHATWGETLGIALTSRSPQDIPYVIIPYAITGILPEEDLPVIALYGVLRHWDRKQPTADLKGVGSRYFGYEGAFNIRSTHGAMAGWMRRQTFVQLQRGKDYLQPQLAAVEAAVKACIQGVTRFWFDVQYDELRLERADGAPLSFSMSEGYRNMVAMIADIAWRAAILNPHLGPEAHLRAEGVVMIDELDLHLHPAWQRRIVDDLRRTFPRIQFIVTTHSPQIVASVARSQVRRLADNQLLAEDPYVEGRDSNEILEDVFGVASRPEQVADEIAALYRLLEDEDFAAARASLATLQERLGPDDAEMVRARWILDTEDPQREEPPSTPP